MLLKAIYNLLWKRKPPYIDLPVELKPGEYDSIIPEKIFKIPFGFFLSPKDSLSTFKVYKKGKYLQHVISFRNIKTYDFYRNNNLALIWKDRRDIKVYIDARDMIIAPRVNRSLLYRGLKYMDFGLIVFEN